VEIVDELVPEFQSMEELHKRLAEVEGERVIEAVKLSQLVREISDALVNLGVIPIWDIPQHPKLAQDVLTAVGLVLERLREEHASSVDPWV
jgi:hypothetical protein